MMVVTKIQDEFSPVLIILTYDGRLTYWCHQCSYKLVGSSLLLFQVSLENKLKLLMWLLCLKKWLCVECSSLKTQIITSMVTHTSTQSLIRWLLALSCMSLSSCLLISSPVKTFFPTSFTSVSSPVVNSTFYIAQQGKLKILVRWSIWELFCFKFCKNEKTHFLFSIGSNVIIVL